MDNIARFSHGDRRELWSRTAERLPPLSDLMIEKDFWVCLTLKHLFGLPGARDHFIFKGGTSLSKVWRAIHRFSEDIDISLSREWLGFGGDRDPEAAGTRKQRKKQLEALSSACGDRLRGEVAPALRSALTGVLGAEGWSLEIDPQDEQTLLFAYPTVFGEMTGRAYIRPVVKIECGARSDRWPVSSGHVTAYVAEAFPDTLATTGVDIPVLDIERTFWEKASILHAEAHRPAEKPIPERYSRHYADLAALAKIVKAGQERWSATTCAPASSRTSWCSFRPCGRTPKRPFLGLFASSRRQSVLRPLPETTRRCGTCFSGSRPRGAKSSPCFRSWKRESTAAGGLLESPRLHIEPLFSIPGKSISA